jgi:hypothetical protein
MGVNSMVPLAGVAAAGGLTGVASWISITGKFIGLAGCGVGLLGSAAARGGRQSMRYNKGANFISRIYHNRAEQNRARLLQG